MRLAVQTGESLLAPFGQMQQVLPAIGVRDALADQPLARKRGQDTAQVSSIETKASGHFGRGALLAMGQFVKDPPLSQGKRSAQEALMKDSDFLRVETIESPDRSDSFLQPLAHSMTMSSGLLTLSSIEPRLPASEHP